VIRRLIDYTVIPLFYLLTLPMCCVIALMDSTNGKGFKHNLKIVMGFDLNPKDRDPAE